MSRIERAYVIDFVVRDMDAAVERFSAILGIEGVRMSREQDPEGYLDGTHFPVGGINALGLMTYLGEPSADSDAPIARLLATRGEGLWVLGHLVDDIDAHSRDLVSAGYPVPQPDPTTYADGRLIFTGEVCGTAFEFATHHSDAVSELWRERHRAATGRRVERAYRVDMAVRDLDGARQTLERFLGMSSDSVKPEELDPSGGLEGVRFAIGGLDELNVVTPRAASGSPLAEQVSAYLGRHGDGAMLMGFVVEDLERAERELRELGVSMGHAEPQPTPRGRANFTEPQCGVVLELFEPAGG